MKLLPFEQPRTERSRSTRICIGRAIFSLMEEQPFEEIRITDIVRRAGVSRMTYYKYYSSKLDALTDYLNEIILEYDREQKKLHASGFFEQSHILHAVTFFERYSSLFTTLIYTGQYAVLVHAVSNFVESRIRSSSEGATDYSPYYYVGGLTSVFLKWLQNGKRESAEELTDIICGLIQGTARHSS